MAGSASYSAQMASVSGPLPAVATNAVGRSATPDSTAKPAPASASEAHADDRSSSKHSSGWACTVWDSSISASPALRTSSCATAFASMLSVNHRHDVAGTHRVPGLHLDLLDRARFVGVD